MTAKHILLSFALIVLACSGSSSAFAAHRLRLTAVTSSAEGKARIQCWEINKPFSEYPTVGDSITGLAQVSNLSYVVLPPKAAEGLHKPPHPMFFILLSGMAHVTLPDGEDELWIRPGVDGMIIAADTVGDGHYTNYPADMPSVALQIPFANGVLPGHHVIHNGPCEAIEYDSGFYDIPYGGQIPLT